MRALAIAVAAVVVLPGLPASAQDTLIARYVALLSAADHYNSAAVLLDAPKVYDGLCDFGWVDTRWIE